MIGVESRDLRDCDIVVNGLLVGWLMPILFDECRQIRITADGIFLLDYGCSCILIDLFFDGIVFAILLMALGNVMLIKLIFVLS